MATATLVDDDDNIVVAFTSAGQMTGEGDAPAPITVALSGVSPVDVTIPYTVSGTAAAGDFTLAPSPIVIPAGDTTAVMAFTITADMLPESDETVVITLGAPSGASLVAPFEYTATILDDDTLGALASDDFNDFNLDTSIWSFVDPLGDSCLSIVGTNTADARLLLSVPAGVDHITWTSLDSARVEQTVADTDFFVEVKLESPLSQAFQEQGLIVREDDTNFLRFDFYHDGTGTRAFSGSITNGVPQSQFDTPVFPLDDRLWVRVQRVGDLWTHEYSVDGVVWSPGASFVRAMSIQTVGVFAGNVSAGGGAPALTAAFDYVFDVNAPIANEDGAFVTDVTGPLVYAVTAATSETTVDVDWKTDELADSTLRYGLTAAYELGSVTDPTLVGEHSLTIPGLMPSTMYFVQLVTADAPGNASSQDFTLTTDGAAPPSVRFAAAASSANEDGMPVQITVELTQLLGQGRPRCPTRSRAAPRRAATTRSTRAPS